MSTAGLPVQQNYPNLVVQMAANNPLDGSRAWFPLGSTSSGAVLEISTSRGRQHELAKFEAGTCTIRFDNRGREYDQSNTTSPYYPNIDVMKPIRVVATYGNVTYPIFTGFTRTWKQSYPSPVEAETTVECVDALGVLNLYKISNVRYAQQVIADGATAYYRLGDPTATNGAAMKDSAGSNDGRFWLVVTPLQAGALPTDVDAACSFGNATASGGNPGGTGFATLPGNVANFGTGAFTIEMWVNVITGGQDPFWSATDITGATNDVLVNVTYPFGFPRFALNLGGNLDIQGTTALTNNTWHHVVCTRAGDGLACKVYLDGQLAASGTANSVRNLNGGGAWLGVTAAVGSPAQPAMAGSLDEVAIYNGTALTAAQVLNHYNLGVGGFGQQFSGTRIGAVLDAIGWPAGARGVDTGRSLTQPVTSTLTQQTALNYMQTVELSEAGQLFCGVDGRVMFFDRYHVLTSVTSNTSQVTVGDNGTDEPYEPAPEIALDDLDTFNNVQVQRVGGLLQQATDTTSQTQYGPRTKSLTGLLLTTDLESLDRANFELNREKTSLQRIRSVTVHPRDDPGNLFPQVLGRELMDRITVNRRPPGGGAVNSQVSYIEGVAHHITPLDWQTTWRTAPIAVAGPPDNTLTLDDATKGVLDANVLGF